MNRQLYKLFFLIVWLTALQAPALAQETGSIQPYPADPGAPAQEAENIQPDLLSRPAPQEAGSVQPGPADPPARMVRHVPDSVPERLKKQKEFLYANDPAFWKKDTPNNSVGKAGASFLGSPLLKIVLYAFLTLLIGFVLYQIIVVNNLFIIRRSRRRKNAADGEETALIPGNLEEKINEAVAEGQYRLAIRYYYLITLRFLHHRNMIRLDARSTNYDYMAQMRGQRAATAFADLTRIYEYVWYGQYQPDTLQFERIRSGFKEFIAAD